MNVEKLSLAELKALNDRVAAAIPVARAREMSAARKELADLAASKGFALKELLAAPAPRRAKTPRKPSTKMKDAKGVIWEGRGRMSKNFDKATAVPV